MLLSTAGFAQNRADTSEVIDLVPEAPALDFATARPPSSRTLRAKLPELAAGGELLRAGRTAATVALGGDTVVYYRLAPKTAAPTARVLFARGVGQGASGQAAYWSSDGSVSLRGLYGDGVAVGQWLELTHPVGVAPCAASLSSGNVQAALAGCGEAHEPADRARITYRLIGLRRGVVHGPLETRTLSGKRVSAAQVVDGRIASPLYMYDSVRVTIPPYVDVAECGRWRQPRDTMGLQEFLRCPERAYLMALYRTVTYPAAARRRRRMGKVVVAFDVLPDGEAERFRVVRSVAPSLDAEAMRAVRAAGRRWVPGMVDGVAVRMGVEREVVFRME